MTRTRPNVLVVCADELRRDTLGCYGHPQVQSPNIDRLAARGTRFTRAYTNSPICVPARAVLATGRYVHETGHWDNAFPYCGVPSSWGHALRDAGYRVESIGKLHYRRAEDDDGFSRKNDAMYVADGVGELVGAIRDDAPHRNGRREIEQARTGVSDYVRYDRRIAQRAAEWIADASHDRRAWGLFVSFASPHPPFIAPQEFVDLYDPQRVPMPVAWDPADWPDHPVSRHFRSYFGWDAGFSESQIRRAVAVYFGLCSFIDHQVGVVLDSLEDSGQIDNTQILFLSDHGAMLGARGAFGKFQFYEESVGIPMIVAGPGVEPAAVCETPVSLIDVHPTILESCGIARVDVRGQSLREIAGGASVNRTVLSEYHAAGSTRGSFMVCDGRHKYIHHVGFEDQLFDLENDPEERSDLLENADGGEEVDAVAGRMREALADLLNPDEVDQRARDDQAALIERHGGRDAVLARGRKNSAIPGEDARVTFDTETG